MTSKINATPSYSTDKQQSLENRYAHLIFQDFEVHKDFGFQDYHQTQNEWPPQNIKPHLHQEQPGITVTTGTERGFWELLFSEEEFCEGLVFRDISPKVKAYIDFNVLLLRISKNMQEYAELSDPIPWWLENGSAILSNRITVITEKTQNSDLPEQVKNYYLKNIKRFGSVYLHLGQHADWRKDHHFSKCWYHQDEEPFLKLQRYAKSGNIIATIGDINDLRFLKDTKINIVDTSNIHDYCVVNLQGEGEFSPKVIWTELTLEGTRYYSAPYTPHEPLNEKEDKEFQTWVALFKQTHPGIGNHKHYFQILTEKLKLEASSLRNNPKEVLSKLRKYMQDSVLPDPNLRIINDPILGYFSLSNLSEINGLSPEHTNILCRNPQTKQHLPFLIGKMSSLRPEHYLAFIKIEGAKEEFERQCSQLNINLDYLLNCTSDSQLLAFTQEFGQSRLETLKKRVALSRLCSKASQTIQSFLPSLAKAGIFVAGLAALGSYWMMRSTASNASE